MRYDKLVLSPGVDLMFDERRRACAAAQADGRILQAWKAGPETVALRRQLEAMPDGGVYAITIPEAPYRCPPGPYERACQVASYFKAAKPKSKVLILDANPDVTSKGALFKKVWAEQYPGMVEFRAAAQGDGGRRAHEHGEVRGAGRREGRRAQRAAADARRRHRGAAGLANCQRALVRRDYLTLRIDRGEGHPRARRLDPARAGDAEVGPHGQQARQGGGRGDRRQLSGWDVNPAPMLTNTCYSFVDDEDVIHVASVHEYVAAEKTFKPVAGSGGVSAGPTELEGTYAWNWARTIWADTLA